VYLRANKKGGQIIIFSIINFIRHFVRYIERNPGSVKWGRSSFLTIKKGSQQIHGRQEEECVLVIKEMK
jgi:hypothetical protein